MLKYFLNSYIITKVIKEDIFMAETKHEKFIRVAESRTNKIIDMVRLLGNCSSIATYEYTDEDVKKIYTAIEQELKICKSKYQDTSNKESKFRLR